MVVFERDEAYLASIRSFLLEPQESYSVAALWRIPCDNVQEVYHDELLSRADRQSGEADFVRISWADALAAGLAFNLLRPYDVERALGEDFGRVRPEHWRTIPARHRRRVPNPCEEWPG